MTIKHVDDYSNRLFVCYKSNDMLAYFTYIMQSRTTGQFYVGSCDDLLKRFKEHQSGYNKSTRGRGPWFLPYYEIYTTRTEAKAREEQIKKKRSSKYIKTTIYSAFPLLELF